MDGFLTVSELSKHLQGVISTHFSTVRLRGEISGLKRHSSGHVYFSLKDSDAVMDAICWRGSATRLDGALQEGMEVLATGRITTYPQRSKYQIIVETLEPAGIGALLKVLEDRKARLSAEGLFAQEHKKRLPYLPRRIGVITSPTGAVIRDILHRLADRFPCSVMLWPVAVQGEGAAGEVIAALQGFEALDPSDKPDVIIVARGGGSVEDLWCFNDEALVRAVATSTIPIISAIGHETDFTLLDYVADHRAPTPTAAAEMAVPVRVDLVDHLKSLDQRLFHGTYRFLKDQENRVLTLFRIMGQPQRLLDAATQMLDDRLERLQIAIQNQTSRALRELSLRMDAWQKNFGTALVAKVEHYGLLLKSLSYEGVLKRGFVLVKNKATGALVLSAASLKTGEDVELRYGDGSRGAKII